MNIERLLFKKRKPTYLFPSRKLASYKCQLSKYTLKNKLNLRRWDIVIIVHSMQFTIYTKRTAICNVIRIITSQITQKTPKHVLYRLNSFSFYVFITFIHKYYQRHETVGFKIVNKLSDPLSHSFYIFCFLWMEYRKRKLCKSLHFTFTSLT